MPLSLRRDGPPDSCEQRMARVARQDIEASLVPVVLCAVPKSGRKRSWRQEADEPRQVVMEVWCNRLKDDPIFSKTGLPSLTGRTWTIRNSWIFQL
eukprot:5499210-Amphidinium_carterae.1